MRKIITIMLVIISVYYLTLLAFGVTTLGNRLAKDSNSTFNIYRWTNIVKVVGNVDIKSVSQKFNYEGVSVEEISASNYEEMTLHIFDKDSYHYILLVNSNYLPVITVAETEHINEYVADWEKCYVWCFVGWILLYDNMTGIS